MTARARIEAECGYKQVLIGMNFLVDIDWLKATEDERKRLYVATRAVADASDLSVEEIIDAALGRKALMGTDYMSTFRRGKIRRSYAKLIHGWVTENHIQIANYIAPDLFALPNTDVWDRYLETHAIHGKLRIARFDRSMGLVQRKRSQPKPEEVLKLGEEFCFHLDSEISGYAVAFQEYEGKLHPLPLGQNDDLATTIEIGEQFLPIGDNGRPEQLSEASDLGHHTFIVAIAEQVKDLVSLDTAPTADSELNTHVVRVYFEP